MKIIGDNFECIENYTVVKKDDNNIIKIRKLRKGEKVSIVSDVMFKTMFQNSSRMKYSAKLISYFVDVSYEELLEKLRLTQNEFDKDKYYTKGERGDYVADFEGINLNIEINNNFKEYVFDRNLEYVFKLYNQKVMMNKRIDSYKYTSVVQLNFNNFYYKELMDKPIDIFSINNGGVKLTNKIVIVQIYLPLLKKKCYDKGVEGLSEQERFILALYEMNLEDSKKIGGSIDIMNDYINTSEEVMEDVSFGESYDKELAAAEANYEDGFEQGRKQGHSEGIKEGISSNKVEIAKKMRNKGYDIETIEELTNLSKNEIEKL